MGLDAAVRWDLRKVMVVYKAGEAWRGSNESEMLPQEAEFGSMVQLVQRIKDFALKRRL